MGDRAADSSSCGSLKVVHHIMDLIGGRGDENGSSSHDGYVDCVKLEVERKNALEEEEVACVAGGLVKVRVFGHSMMCELWEHFRPARVQPFSYCAVISRWAFDHSSLYNVYYYYFYLN